MTRLKLTGALCSGMISLMGTTLLAQQSTTSSIPGSTINDNKGAPRLNSTDGSTEHWQHSGHHVRLGELMNAPVQSESGKTLGYIRDFTVEPRSGHLQFAILALSSETGVNALNQTAPSSGIASPRQDLPANRETTTSSRSSLNGSPSNATAQMSGKLIPVPWQLFSQSWRGNQEAGVANNETRSDMNKMHHLVLNIDESKLQSAPSFDGSNWSELHQGNFNQRVYSYFGVNPMSDVGTTGSSISGQGTSDERNIHRESGDARGGGADLKK